MPNEIQKHRYNRQPTEWYTSARQEIEAAIHRVQREGQSVPPASRTIIREVPTMPERILAWECRTCGYTIRQEGNGWHKCRLCGQDAVRRTRVRPNIQEQRWRGRETRTWPRRTTPWNRRPAETINDRG